MNKKSKFMREQEELEELEQEHFKRKSITKHEKKLMKRQEREQLNDRIEQLDDLNGLIQFT